MVLTLHDRLDVVELEALGPSLSEQLLLAGLAV